MSAQPGDQLLVVDRAPGPAEAGGVPERARRSELADLARSEVSLRRFLHGLPGVDQVGAEQRAAGLATRSIKAGAKLWAIDTAISMVDLTTLEGADTPGKVRALCGKARRPDPDDPERPAGGGGLRLPRPRPHRPGRSGRQPGQGGLGGHGFPLGASLVGGQARRRRRRGRRRGRRGGHGHRPGRFPGRPLRRWCSKRCGR